jgi:hypothetical protein
MKIANLLVAFALLITTGSVFAQAQAKRTKTKSLHDQFTGQGYGMAGCGLGSVVFGQEPGLVQIVAVTLNQTGYQTLAITSGTSNCGESGKQARAKQFINVNKEALSNDIARGSGDSVASLAEVMGCQNTDFSTQLRKNYVAGTSSEQLTQVATQACKL